MDEKALSIRDNKKLAKFKTEILNLFEQNSYFIKKRSTKNFFDFTSGKFQFTINEIDKSSHKIYASITLSFPFPSGITEVGTTYAPLDMAERLFASWLKKVRNYKKPRIHER